MLGKASEIYTKLITDGKNDYGNSVNDIDLKINQFLKVNDAFVIDIKFNVVNNFRTALIIYKEGDTNGTS